MGGNEYGLASTAPPVVVTAAAATTTTTDLGPVGKTVASVVEIAFTVVLEYLGGFMSGYFLGTLVGIPGFVTKPISTELRLPLLREMAERAARLHGRSYKWARDWGVLSCAFGGSQSLVKVLRKGKQDEWNSILSSMMGGAILARKQGPQAMVRGALLYGMFVYAMSSMKRKNTDDFSSYEYEYEEF
jgi:hypothetical protein